MPQPPCSVVQLEASPKKSVDQQPEVQPEAPAPETLALVPFRPKGPKKATLKAFREKCLAGLADLGPEECRVAMEAQMKTASDCVAEAKAKVAERDAEVGQARAEYREAATAVQDAIKEELSAAAEYRRQVLVKEEAKTKVEAIRAKLFESQKRMAMLEVLKANKDATQQLLDKRRAALEAAMEASKSLAEHKQRQKALLGEATKKLARTSGGEEHPAKKSRRSSKAGEVEGNEARGAGASVAVGDETEADQADAQGA